MIISQIVLVSLQSVKMTKFPYQKDSYCQDAGNQISLYTHINFIPFNN